MTDKKNGRREERREGGGWIIQGQGKRRWD